MKKLVAAMLMGFVLVPVLAVPAQAGGGWHGGHGQPGGGCCWGAFGVGVGVGVLATAPFWYPRYAYPAYAYPAYPYPAYAYPAYSVPGLRVSGLPVPGLRVPGLQLPDLSRAGAAATASAN